MWFKNARIYRLELSEEIKNYFKNEELLEKTISEKAFRPCMAQEVSTLGFAPIFGKNAKAFTFSNAHNHFFKIVEENKLLPASVIKNELDEEIENKEIALKRELRKNEKQALKTAVVNKLLAQAFSARRELLICVNSEKGYVAVSVSSAKRAERAIAMLIEAFSTFPAKCFQPRCVVEDRMTAWISNNDLPNVFTLGNDATLKSTDDEGGTVKVSKEDLSSDEIAVHINAGKVITDLQLIFEDTVMCVLSSDLTVKRMRPLDQFLEKNLPEKSDDAVADMAAHLCLQGEVLTSLIDSISEIFDCE